MNKSQEGKSKGMICPNCNLKIPEEAKFCPSCGFNLGDGKSRGTQGATVSPDINVSPTISSSGDVQFSPNVTISPTIHLGSETEDIRKIAAELQKELKGIHSIQERDLESLESKYGKEEMLRILESFKIISQMSDLCAEGKHPLGREFLEKLKLLQDYVPPNIFEPLYVLMKHYSLNPGDPVLEEEKQEIRRCCGWVLDRWIAHLLRHEQ